jgi:hypothetical protein
MTRMIITLFAIIQMSIIAVISDNSTKNSSISLLKKLIIDLAHNRLVMNGTLMTIEEIKEDQTNEVLEQNLASFCIYGENPRLEEICPKIKSDDHTANLTLKYIESRIVNSTIIKRLKNNCKTLTEWCIPESVTHLSDTADMTKISTRTEKVLCQFSSCYSSVKSYIKNCVKSELSRDILSLGENICQINNSRSNTHNFCKENTMRLIHLSVARHNLTQFEVNILLKLSLKKST